MYDVSDFNYRPSSTTPTVQKRKKQRKEGEMVESDSSDELLGDLFAIQEEG